MIRVSCLVVTLLLLYRITGQAEPTTCLGSTPTERLISNLERLVSDKPGDASLHFTLARAHSIAYALNSPVIRDCETGSPTTNVLSDFAGNVRPIPTAPTAYRSGADAQRHLNAAIAGYVRAVSLAPEDAFARLGYGWALQQAGRITEAIAQYRQAIAVAWPGDERRNTRPAPQGLERTEWLPPMGWTRFVTVEAGEYLIPLLDATGDAQEIAALRDRMAFIAKAPRMISPVVVPLQRDLGLTGVLDPTARVSFDLDGLPAYVDVDHSGCGLAYAPHGVRFSDGSTRTTYDVLLHER